MQGKSIQFILDVISMPVGSSISAIIKLVVTWILVNDIVKDLESFKKTPSQIPTIFKTTSLNQTRGIYSLSWEKCWYAYFRPYKLRLHFFLEFL